LEPKRQTPRWKHSPQARTPRRTVSDIRPGAAIWVATVGGVGYFPVAPGTAGSLVGVGIVLALGLMPVAPAWRIAAVALAAIILLVLGAAASSKAETFFGRVDPSQVVIDEVVGQMIALAVLPTPGWKTYVAGFLLFRFFDIVKPFPAGRCERFAGGWGIMLDDVVAGAYSLLVLLVGGLVIK
jgi:phosphatidylglycerophosphatase A